MAPIFLSANPRLRNFIWLKEHYKSQASVYKETHFAKKKCQSHVLFSCDYFPQVQLSVAK